MIWAGKRGCVLERKKILSFRRGDLLAVGIVVALTVVTMIALYTQKGTVRNTRAQIYQNGELLHTVSLGENQTVTVEGDYTNTITVQDGRIAITASDCPGGDCVHSGWIGRAGRSIVCLPNRTEIRIVGEDAVDFTVG